MKKPPDRDWPATIVLWLLILVSLVLALFDPSCQRHSDPSASPSHSVTPDSGR